MIKLAIIGSGSMVFTRRIVTDLLLDKNLSEMEIALMDIDPEKLRVSQLIVNAVANQIGVTVDQAGYTTIGRGKANPVW